MSREFQTKRLCKSWVQSWIFSHSHSLPGLLQWCWDHLHDQWMSEKPVHTRQIKKHRTSIIGASHIILANSDYGKYDINPRNVFVTYSSSKLPRKSREPIMISMHSMNSDVDRTACLPVLYWAGYGNTKCRQGVGVTIATPWCRGIRPVPRRAPAQTCSWGDTAADLHAAGKNAVSQS